MTARRVALITGASQGIGRHIALEFAGAGYDLVLASRNQGNLEETAALVSAVETLVVPTDVTDEESVGAMAARAIEHFGQIDTLVNNSGIGGPSGPLWELDPIQWRETFAVNVDGVFLVTRAILPSMIERGQGSVTVIGSITGKRPLWGRTPYAATKSALVGLTRTLAVEAGRHGVRVNLISPGFVDGPRLDWVMEAQAVGRGIDAGQVKKEFEAEAALERLTQPEDVAKVAVFLASDQAAAISGADINVNSGVVMY